eukprot:606367-Rhodomonas_salina.1
MCAILSAFGTALRCPALTQIAVIPACQRFVHDRVRRLRCQQCPDGLDDRHKRALSATRWLRNVRY